jgi:hypothetical protein
MDFFAVHSITNTPSSDTATSFRYSYCAILRYNATHDYSQRESLYVVEIHLRVPPQLCRPAMDPSSGLLRPRTCGAYRDKY